MERRLARSIAPVSTDRYTHAKGILAMIIIKTDAGAPLFQTGGGSDGTATAGGEDSPTFNRPVYLHKIPRAVVYHSFGKIPGT